MLHPSLRDALSPFHVCGMLDSVQVPLGRENSHEQHWSPLSPTTHGEAHPVLH